MGNNYYQKYSEAISHSLASSSIQLADGTALDLEAGFDQLSQWTREATAASKIIYFIGNGASATMASHYALDFTKNAGCRALCFNDLASLTAIGNDCGYDQVFALPLRAFLKPGDILATISSSGNSPNVVAALKVARELGAKTVTFSSLKPDNISRKTGDLNFYAPAKTYGIAECAHAILLHCWLDYYMGVEEWNQTK